MNTIKKMRPCTFTQSQLFRYGAFGPTSVCIVAKNVNPKTGAVITPVNDDTVTGMPSGTTPPT
jgi:hypothetical protein